jgi:hypothetical protein
MFVNAFHTLSTDALLWRSTRQLACMAGRNSTPMELDIRNTSISNWPQI